MLENIIVFFIVIMAVYFLIKNLCQSRQHSEKGCSGCLLSKNGFNCKALKDKIKQKD